MQWPPHQEIKMRSFALRHLSLTLGGLPKIAKATELNAASLYRTLSPNGGRELNW
jgi:DNA-binding phage protein